MSIRNECDGLICIQPGSRHVKHKNVVQLGGKRRYKEKDCGVRRVWVHYLCDDVSVAGGRCVGARRGERKVGCVLW